MKVAANSSALLGAVVGTGVSTDEVFAIATGGGGGVGLPVNIAIGAAAIGSEMILLVRLQLQLVANLGRLYGAPLDADDPAQRVNVYILTGPLRCSLDGAWEAAGKSA